MLPGTSVTYYGEEIGMVDRCAEFDDDHELPAKVCDPTGKIFGSEWARSPMQWDDTKNAGFSPHDAVWLPVADNYKKLNVKAQEKDERSHLEVYKNLLRLRKDKAIQESEKFEIVALSAGALAFKR
jgi:alpha-glucosidase